MVFNLKKQYYKKKKVKVRYKFNNFQYKLKSINS